MKLKNQSGRSMVEMLGVLAIVGVLSVGGIAGYKMAMEQIGKNKMLNLANQFALMVETEFNDWENSFFNDERCTPSACVDCLKEDTEYLDAYIEEIDEDLGMLEEDYYEDGGCDCDDEDCGCDDDFVEVECPECGETVCLDDSIDFDHVICPACGAEFSCVCDCCDDGDDNDECECGCGGKRGE